MNTDSLEVLQLGHPHLRKTSVAVSDLTSVHFQSFVDTLLLYVNEVGGMGIAAPQVDVDKRLFIICSRPNSRYPNAPTMKPTVVINPEIIRTSVEIEKDWEGCLSVPGIRGLVPRHQTLSVRYLTRHGEIVQTEYSGFVARIFQHELDHLDGIVFLDRVRNTHDIMTEQEWLKRVVNAKT